MHVSRAARIPEARQTYGCGRISLRGWPRLEADSKLRVALHASKVALGYAAHLPGRPSGPIAISTTVPLTITVLKPTLDKFESCPT